MQTTNRGLSQIEPNDKPTWLGTYNNDMNKINDELDKVESKSDSQTGQINDKISDINNKDNIQDNNITELKNSTELINQIMGKLSELRTIDKSSIKNAINEIVPEVTGIYAGGGIFKIGNVLIQFGSISMAVTTANVAVSASVEFQIPYKISRPAMVSEIISTDVRTDISCRIGSPTTTGFIMMFNAPSTTARPCQWLALGYV